MKNWLPDKISPLDVEVNKLVGSKAKKDTPFDTCLKFTPVALLFAFDATRFSTKNNYKTQLLQVAAGELVLNAGLQPLKKTVKKVRPNGKLKSFPSGHTATCIFGAQLLHQELKDNYPVISCSGYGITAITALLRLYHKKHWLSDVVSGAALGLITFTVIKKILNKALRQS